MTPEDIRIILFGLVFLVVLFIYHKTDKDLP